MKLPALFLIAAAFAVTLGAGQAQTLTAKAQAVKPFFSAPAPTSGDRVSDYCVRLEGMRVKRGAGGVEITGRLVNTGRRPLTYTSVVPVMTGADGREQGRGVGYLTSSPVGLGQSAGFRGYAAAVPSFAGVTLVLHEAGQPVTVQK